MRTPYLIISLILLFFLGGGCTTTVDPMYHQMVAQSFQTTGSSTLGSGDVISLSVYGEEELSGDFVVLPSGKISFPLVGNIEVEGKNCSGVEQAVVSELKNGYLRNPSLSCSVKEYNSRKVYIFGEVEKPGTFRYEQNMTIIQGITLAGGFSDIAWKNRTNITRIIDERETNIVVPIEKIVAGQEKNFFLKPGDIIFIPEAPW